jgi:2-succinyl-5-enolpyruvyl-6-hydroxy-3-cyclohexene-1-carboxylate synthase
MLVCTADRPAELQGVGAPQTTDQTRLFDGFTRWAVSAGPELPADAWRSLAARARSAAHDGPVHLNLQFREPLVGPADELPAGRDDGQPWHVPLGATVPSVPSVPSVPIKGGRRGVVFSAFGDSRGLARRLGWPVLLGPQSDCTRAAGDVVTVSAFDGILRHLGAELRPEVVVCVGGFPASKITNAWIEESGAELLCFDPRGRWR